MQQALYDAFPECRDLNHDPSRGITEFVPHLGVGQAQSRDALVQAEQVQYKFRSSACCQAVLFAQILLSAKSGLDTDSCAARCTRQHA